MSSEEQRRDSDESAATAVCVCTHPTHFLGRCQAAVKQPAHVCDSCMQTHFNLVDDPAI